MYTYDICVLRVLDTICNLVYSCSFVVGEPGGQNETPDLKVLSGDGYIYSGLTMKSFCSPSWL